ncbi:MAG: hypothetical protein JW751_21215 [Polyangiaceae bacterium]|nr:hypothetical protein [Polyangiaceae bacterium]
MELPSVPALRAIVERFARLRSRLGEELGSRPLVLPTTEFFPDEFRADEASVKRLISRMKRHAGMSDIPTRTRLVGDDDHCGCASGSCGAGSSSHHGGGSCSGGCGPTPADPEFQRLVDLGDRWRISVPAAELRNPVILGTNLARVLSFVFLAETLREGDAIEPPGDVTADLTGVLLGFGVLLLQGSYIYQKSCGGPRIGRATKLRPGELAIATALFAKLGGHRGRRAQRELDPTQAAVFAEARAWVDSNAGLVEAIRRHPKRVARGEFQLADTQPWLLRVLGRQEQPAPEEGALGAEGFTDGSLAELDDLLATLPEPRATRKARPRSAVDDELKALVAEALAESSESEEPSESAP